MGAKLTKSKSFNISGKTEEQQHIDTTTIVANTNNHHDLSTNTDDKQTTKDKSKNKKKKEEKLNKKSSKTKVDKSTNTENCVLPSSSFAEQLVGEQVSPVINPISLDIKTVQANGTYPSELSDTCVQNDNQQNYNENHHQTNNLDAAEEVVNNVSPSIITNGDAVHGKEQQAQFIKS
jgi:hypothetical protein